ncbi:MAG: hypothetical protein K2R98_16835 [Gemmataceae bacterium]|nr:hypothetical protein [Gemmataceae bacterium]
MQPEISFSTGTLRQPGVWGKILKPPAHGIYDVDLISDEFMVVKGSTTTVTPQHLTEGLLLVFGIKGYKQAMMLTSVYVLMRVKAGAHLDWQFPGHLARFEGKEVELLAQSENDLAPIYTAVKDGGYIDVDRVRQTLRNEGKDRG